MAVGGVSFPTPQAFSGGIDWSPLANLGNVYQQSQDRSRRLSALSQLGSDPNANAMALIKSGDPQLAQQGLALQSQQQARQQQAAQQAEQVREFNTQQAIRQAQEERAAATYEEDSPTARAQKLVAQGIDPKDPSWRTWLLTGSGAPDVNKLAGNKIAIEQQERDARTADALKRGFPKDQADVYGLTGKFPKQEELSAGEKKMVDTAENNARTADDVIGNLNKLKELSPKAWSGAPGAFMTTGGGQYLPGFMTPEGAVNAQEAYNITHQNVLEQLKPLLGARPAVYEAQLMKELETTPQMSDELRQRIYDRLIKTITTRRDAANAQAEGIRNRSYFKPGGGQPTAQPTQEVPPAEAPAQAPAPAAPQSNKETVRAAAEAEMRKRKLIP